MQYKFLCPFLSDSVTFSFSTGVFCVPEESTHIKHIYNESNISKLSPVAEPKVNSIKTAQNRLRQLNTEVVSTVSVVEEDATPHTPAQRVESTDDPSVDEKVLEAEEAPAQEVKHPKPEINTKWRNNHENSELLQKK